MRYFPKVLLGSCYCEDRFDSGAAGDGGRISQSWTMVLLRLLYQTRNSFSWIFIFLLQLLSSLRGALALNFDQNLRPGFELIMHSDIVMYQESYFAFNKTAMIQQLP